MSMMNTLTIGVLLTCIAVNNCYATSTSANAGASSNSDGSGGTFTQTSGPHGTFTTSTGDGAPFAPFHGQPAFGLPGPFIPIPQFDPAPLVTPVDFSSALNKYLNSIQRHYAAGGSYSYATPGATVSATTYLGPTNDLYQQQQNLIEQWRDAQLNYYQNTYGHNTYPNGGVGAAATATYGPGGVHQTASLYPSNPNKPNLDTRFGEESSAGAPSGTNYFGVGTASFSSSSDINGQKTQKHGAITSVNDNGKVTTYRLGE